MMHYLDADLWRINRRLPRIIGLVLCVIIGAIITITGSHQKSFNFVKLGETIASSLQYLPFLMTMLNLYFVFEDDLQVKTMQTAIGSGIRRVQVVFVKWMEIVLLSLMDCTALVIVGCSVGLAKGVSLKGAAISHVGAQLCGTMLNIAVMTALIMILIFRIMHLGLTQLLFFLLILKPVSLIFGYLEMTREFLAKIQLSRFLIGANLDAFAQALENGRFNFGNLAVILIYWGIGMGAAYSLFRKKELDF